MSTLFENLTAALACHQSGDRHEAERLYRRILDEDMPLDQVQKS